MAKHSYSSILHQEEVSDQPKVGPNCVPIVYFLVHLVKYNNHGTLPRRNAMQSIGQFKNSHLSSRHKVHTVLQPQATCSILYHWDVQPSAWPLGFAATAVWHPVQTHLRQIECSGWCYLPAQDLGPVPRQWQWWHNGIKWWCGRKCFACYRIDTQLTQLQHGETQLKCPARGTATRQVFLKQSEIHENKTGPELHTGWQHYTHKGS